MSGPRKWSLNRRLLLGLLWACLTLGFCSCSGGGGDSGGGTAGPGGTPGEPTTSPGTPMIFFVDVEAGATTGGPSNQGAPISIFGKGFGATRGSSKVTIGGVEVAAYLVWGQGNAHNPMLDMVVVQPGLHVTGGVIEITVEGKKSNEDFTFTVLPGARVLYVASSGSDSSNLSCAEASPCKTISHAAITVANPGDVVLVRGPSLDEGEVWIREVNGDSGISGAPKVIKTYPGEAVTFPNGSRPVILEANYITVSGFQFQNGKSVNGGGVTNKGNKIIDCTFSGEIGYDAIGTHGDDHLLAGNVCDLDGATTGTQGHCYYISHGKNLQLLWNVAKGSWPGYGIHIYDQRRAIPDFKREIHDVVVEGNVLRGSDERSGMIIAIDDEGGYGNNIDNITVRNNVFTGNNHHGFLIAGTAKITNIKIYSNTFYQNGRQGLHISGTANNIQGVEIKNNLFDITTNSWCTSNCGWFSQSHFEVISATGIVADRNGYLPGPPVTPGATDANPVTGTILFENPALDDWRVKAGGATIDKGGLVPVARDFRGMPRPQGSGHDIGAFERGPMDP